MITICINVEPYPQNRLLGLNNTLNNSLDIVCDGLQKILDALEGLGRTVTFVISDSFKEHKPGLSALVKKKGHTMKTETSSQSLLLGKSLSLPIFNYVPTDIFKILSRNATLVYDAYLFSEALYEPQYRATKAELKNAGQKAITRLSMIIV